MRWKENFFIHDKQTQIGQKEKYGFKTRLCPGQCPELQEFEKYVTSIVPNVKFEKSRDPFQRKQYNENYCINKSPCTSRQNEQYI